MPNGAPAVLRFIAVLFASVAMLAVASGCTSIVRGAGSVTGNKYAKARSGTVWIVPPPQLEPPGTDDRAVYISYRNISDADVDLRSLLRQSAMDQGWSITDDPQAAKYRLRASTRFFGEVAPESGGSSVGSSMGWIAGAAVGVGTAALVADVTDSWGVGVAAGAAAGGLVGQAFSLRSEPREWALIIDFVLEEYSDQPIEFEVLSETGSRDDAGAGVGNTRMSDAGGTRRESTTSGTLKRSSQYFPHGVRLSAWANQMNMQEDEALPLILERVERVVQQMLPQ